MKDEFFKYTLEGNYSDACELLRKAEKEKIRIRDLFEPPPSDFNPQSNLDWELLEKVAQTETPLGKLWSKSRALSPSTLILYSVLCLLISPLLITLSYNWVLSKLPIGSLFDIIPIIIILLSSIGISALLISSLFYLQLDVFHRKKRTIWKNRTSMSISVLCGTLATIFVLILSFSLNRDDALFDLKFNYRDISNNIDRQLLVHQDYLGLINDEANIKDLMSEISLTLNSPALLQTEGISPQYLSAAALLLDKEGRHMEAQRAYFFGRRIDLFDTDYSRRVNNAPSLSILRNWENEKRKGQIFLIETEYGPRFISKEVYASYFSSQESINDLVSNKNISCLSAELCNAQAVAWERLSNKEEAYHAYEKALASHRYDPTILVNAKSYLKATVH